MKLAVTQNYLQALIISTPSSAAIIELDSTIITFDEFDQLFGETPAEFSAMRATINQVQRINEDGEPVIIYFLLNIS